MSAASDVTESTRTEQREQMGPIGWLQVITKDVCTQRLKFEITPMRSLLEICPKDSDSAFMKLILALSKVCSYTIQLNKLSVKRYV